LTDGLNWIQFMGVDSPTPARPLAGRVAVVTGASSGLGARFALVLAQAGAQVVAAARRLDRLEELARETPGVHPLACDVTDDDGPRRLVHEALERFDRLDVCVNNAGISSGGPDRQATLDGFRSVLRVNLEALFAVSQAAAGPMRERGSGSVINVSSMFGSVASSPVPDAGYVASKSAVNGLTRELAAQWAPDGVRVNAIAPGFFPSEMTAELFEDERSQRWFERRCPMGRPGRIDELDGVLLFLASDASSYCTGQVITVDGGWTIR
jgi:NAD(P)-dependent dehydrogenase (short-subunit alcohol dehydrogenase family)